MGESHMSEQPAEKTRTIQQTNALIRSIVEVETLDYPFWMGGIVTRHFVSDRGHVYFTLNDENYSISCFLVESRRGTLDFTISNGMEIEVFGTVRVYERRGEIQIEVEKARLIRRSLYTIDKTVQEQLEKMGLWPKTLKSIPQTISAIGVITSKNSEALHDFRETYRRENGLAEIKFSDVRIQGQQAPREIADTINRLNKQAQVDVIALVRGGGRSADLSVFNDLLIAEAIGRSRIPVVTGIGHQQDSTLADQMADYSAITPTDAGLFLAKQGEAVSSSKTARSTSLYLVLALVVIATLVIVLAAILLTSRAG